MPTNDFDGQVALVTGAASGIGLATARLLAARGAQVLVTDRDAKGAERAAAEMAQRERMVAQRLDVRLEADWEDATRTALERWGRLDVLVANAGISRAQPVVETTLDAWREVMAVNLDGVFLG